MVVANGTRVELQSPNRLVTLNLVHLISGIAANADLAGEQAKREDAPVTRPRTGADARSNLELGHGALGRRPEPEILSRARGELLRRWVVRELLHGGVVLVLEDALARCGLPDDDLREELWRGMGTRGRGVECVCWGGGGGGGARGKRRETRGERREA